MKWLSGKLAYIGWSRKASLRRWHLVKTWTTKKQAYRPGRGHSEWVFPNKSLGGNRTQEPLPLESPPLCMFLHDFMSFIHRSCQPWSCRLKNVNHNCKTIFLPLITAVAKFPGLLCLGSPWSTPSWASYSYPSCLLMINTHKLWKTHSASWSTIKFLLNKAAGDVAQFLGVEPFIPA